MGNQNSKNTILEVEHLSYTYGNGKTALKDVNVKIYAGEKIAIIGSNGAGKSTFFLNLNGVYEKDSGEIRYHNETMTRKNLKTFRKNIGIVFQDADNQIVASTVKDEIAFGPINLKLTREDIMNRVQRAMAYLKLEAFAERPPHYLSGGEKKRVSIASILSMESEIMIFDEPTASLDPVNSEMLEDVLTGLSEMGKTLMISTHDVDFVYRWAERILVFDGGMIIADGTPQRIFSDLSILERANLKQPFLFKTYEMLVESGILKSEDIYPKSIEALEDRLKTSRTNYDRSNIK